jgi:parallel beta-helix repeat protein
MKQRNVWIVGSIAAMLVMIICSLIWLMAQEGRTASAHTAPRFPTSTPEPTGDHCVWVGPGGGEWCGCIWGFVFDKSWPVAEAEVTVEYGDWITSTTTAHWEQGDRPYYALPLEEPVSAGDKFTVTAKYDGRVWSEVIIVAPNIKGEQQINLAVPTDTSDTPIFYVCGSASQREICRMNHDGTNRTYIRDGFDPDICPLNGRVLFVYDGDIHVMESDGTYVTNLSPGGYWDYNPDWSPDCSQIVYASASSDWRYWLYKMDADGGNKTALPSPSGSIDDWYPEWSPDGEWIAFTSSDGNKDNIFLMRPDGSGITQLTTLGGWFPTWSPSGKRIAYVDTSRGENIYTMKADGTDKRRVTYDFRPWWPYWISENRLMYVTGSDAPNGEHLDVYSINVNGTCKVNLTNDGNSYYRSPTVRPTYPPVAVFSSITPNPAWQDETITFRGQGVDADEDGDSVPTYRWWIPERVLSTRRTFTMSGYQIPGSVFPVYFQACDDEGECSEPISQTLTITPTRPNYCYAQVSSTPGITYTHAQAAVDAASDGDVVKIAGACSGVESRAGVTQTVYISKSVAVQGGYHPSDWETADPKANPTWLDAQGLGRVIYITGPVTVTLENLHITNGDATGLEGRREPEPRDAGGGVYVHTSTVTINKCQIYGNVATTAPESGLVGGFGGGLYLKGSRTVLSNSMLQNNVASNEAAGWGGGLHIEDSQATLNNNFIRYNLASIASQGQGGGIYSRESDTTLTRNTLTDNAATITGDGYGGGLYVHEGNVTVMRNVILSNTASIQGHGDGGGLYVNTVDETLITTLGDNLIQGNVTSINGSGYGGGLYLTGGLDGNGKPVQGNVLVKANTIVANTAQQGGGVHLTHSYATLQDNTIRDNSATTSSGGGLYLLDCDATLQNNVVSGNVAADCGGGLSLQGNNTILTGNTISTNMTEERGGGICLAGSDARLVNNIVTDNQADITGSGLYINQSLSHMLHNTFARNRGGDGSGISVIMDGTIGFPSTVTLTNTILVSHAVGVYVTPGNTATLTATLWGSGDWANDIDWSGAGTIITGEVNLWGDPAFADPTLGDYHLTQDSAAIGVGVSAGVTTDVDGDVRPLDAGYDIGADEYSVPIAVINYIEYDSFPGPAVQEQDIIYLDGQGYDTDEEGEHTTGYQWSSDLDGPLSTRPHFTVHASRLSVGTHTISFRVRDDENAWSLPVTQTLVVEPSPAEVLTLILINYQKLETLYGSSGATQVLNKAHEFAAHDAVKGLIVRVDENPAVAQAYAYWDANPTDTNRANAVTAAIKNLVDAHWSEHPDLVYMVIIGDDRVFPFHRVPDRTRFQEHHYPYVSCNSITGAAICQGMTLTDDYYADKKPVLPDGPMWNSDDPLYIPDVAVGRLVERPEEIIAQIDTFLENDEITAINALVTGYDVFKVAARATCRLLKESELATDCLLGNRWGRDKLTSLLNTRHTLVTLCGHADHFVLDTPRCNRLESRECVFSTDLLDINADYARIIIYNPGCHSGLCVSPENPYQPLDFPQALARQSVIYIGNTGYGWMYNDSIGLSMRLMYNFTENLAYGQSATVGQALVAAKQQYYRSKNDLSHYSGKILVESTLFGLPMYRYNTSPKSFTQPPTAPVQSRQSTDIGANLTVLSIDYRFPPFTLETTEDGSRYVFDSHVQYIEHGQPVQPLYIADFSLRDKRGHGVVFKGGDYTDMPDFDPIVAQAVTTTQTIQFEPTFNAPGWTPLFPHRLNHLESTDWLAIPLAQFNSENQTERVYHELNFDVYYHANSDDWTGPSIKSISSETDAGHTQVAVKARDSSGILVVVVAYTAGDGAWVSVELTEHNGQWIGSFPTSATTEFFVQVVDRAGNVAIGNELLEDPSAIDLLSFIVQVAADRVTLAWETGSEVDNAGFNVWRAETADGTYIQLNDALIPAQGDPLSGASYNFTDSDMVQGMTYYYKLEDVDTHGVSTFHGPVSATPSPVRHVYLPLLLK